MPKPETLVIKNGSIVTHLGISQQDILIQGESIAQIGSFGDHSADKVVDATGLLVLPGALDTHVHFNDEFMGTTSVHNYYTGTRAAVYGGVTSVIDFSNQAPGASLLGTLSAKEVEAQGQALIDWGVHPVITQLYPKTLAEIPVVVKKGAPTIKCYMTYRSEGLMMEEDDLKQIAEHLRLANGMLLLHAEDNDIIEANVPSLIQSGLTQPIYHARSRPPETEENAIRQAIRIARETGARLFIVHMASDKGIDLISQAQREGVDIYAETCTHYLMFTESQLELEDGIKWICSPPLRNQAIQEALWLGIKDGPISLVSSDDAAFSWQAKLLGKDRFDKCPNGIPGIEPRLNLLFSEGVKKERISLTTMVELISTSPARLFGLFPTKGTIAPGSDADIVLFDPQKKWTMGLDTLHMATDWSAYEGIEITGKILKVFSRGELILDGEQLLGNRGRGRYLHRTLHRGFY